MLQYKGYYGSVEYSADDEFFFGKLQFIRDLVSYEGVDATSVKAAFAEAVEDYLEQCATQGRAPDQPFKGTFNVRIGADLHRRAALAAARRGVSINKLVIEALEHETGAKCLSE
ncbi:MAG: type II toxin-antitoxin system HicB family antitoxin [Nitrococcus sp.]|nr:type II toxin-antitoxin system HicB family antitoxin [Nitrococcus sp.]